MTPIQLCYNVQDTAVAANFLSSPHTVEQKQLPEVGRGVGSATYKKTYYTGKPSTGRKNLFDQQPTTTSNA